MIARLCKETHTHRHNDSIRHQKGYGGYRSCHDWIDHQSKKTAGSFSVSGQTVESPRTRNSSWSLWEKVPWLWEGGKWETETVHLSYAPFSTSFGLGNGMVHGHLFWFPQGVQCWDWSTPVATHVLLSPTDKSKRIMCLIFLTKSRQRRVESTRCTRPMRATRPHRILSSWAW